MLTFRVHCSKGTYIRTLAEDIALELGSCAHLKTLRRLDVEPFREQDMISLQELESRLESESPDEFLLPVDQGLSGWTVINLDESDALRFQHGNPVQVNTDHAGLVRVYNPTGKLLGIGEINDDKLLKPKRIMHL